MRWIPTLLSLVRLVAAPFVFHTITGGDARNAFLWVVPVGLTDFFDGYLARRFGWQSRYGAWADAVSDKVLLSAIFIALAVIGAVPVWLVALIFGRDVVILSMAGYALAFTTMRDFPPSLWGKLSTNVQIFTSGSMLVALTGWWAPASTIAAVMVWVAAAATGFSGVHYVYVGVQRLASARR